MVIHAYRADDGEEEGDVEDEHGDAERVLPQDHVRQRLSMCVRG